MHIGPEDNFIIMNAVLLSTSSFGNMTLRSANWMDPPVINPNWLSTEGDMEQMYAAFMRMREIVSNWSSVQAEISPGPGVRTKEQIIQFIRDNAGFIYHGTSTAKMGKRGDPNSVSDSRARVFGVKGLRVVDASAFPTSPPGHPMSSICKFLIPQYQNRRPVLLTVRQTCLLRRLPSPSSGATNLVRARLSVDDVVSGE